MSYNLENANLILNSRDAIKSQTGTLFTWQNINLDTLLGPMANKYELFNICLSYASSSTTSADITFTTVNDRNLAIYMEGLSFVNQTYNSKTNTNGSQTFIGFILLPSNTSTAVAYQSYQSFYLASFCKTSSLVNISIQLKRLDGVQPSRNNDDDLPPMFYSFDIYGVNPKKKYIDNRLQLPSFR